jgi:arylsulfatase A-like enzyme
MKPFQLLSLLLLVGTPLVAQADERQPNVIVVMADDISARDLPIYESSECYGERASTPVLDRLAKEGCYLTTAWSSTVCMPTRAMVMCGRYAHLTKWWDNGEFGKAMRRGGGIYEVAVSSPLTIGHVAKQAGYRSIWVGKTHVTTGSSYTKFAFDEGVFTPGEPGVRGTSPYDHFKNVKNKEFWNSDSFLWWPEVQVANHPSHPDEPHTWQETKISDYGPDIEMERIFDFMERSRKQDKPFFVYHTSHLGHQAVDMASPRHNMTWPGTPKLTWNVDSKTYTRHEPKITAYGPVNTLSTTYEKENITPDELRYQVEYLDYQMWQYVNKLKEMGELENTIVIFTSDNATKSWKASVEKQRSVHVPFIVYAPGQSALVKGKQNIISDLSDLLPTLADIMGVELPSQDEYELNGKSLWPYLTKESDKHRDWIYGFKGNSQLVRGHKLLRDGKGKWWDASEQPADMDSFPEITDFAHLSAAQQKEKATMEEVLQRFARVDVGGSHSFHEDPARKLTEQEKEKIRLKRERLEEHLKQFK